MSAGDVVVDHRHILIIGAGPGLGAAVARRFAEEGFRITLVGRREKPLDALAAELRDRGTVVDTVIADARDQPSFRSRLRTLADADAPGVVVYNAALVTRDSILSADIEYLLSAFTVDVLGAVTAAQLFTPAMVRAGAGTFLTTGGGPGLHAEPEHATLSIGKAALRAVTSMLHDELAPQNVHASIVTVDGDIAVGTAFAPERIAEVYWRLHRQPRPEWRAETVFDG